jgi:hypothetical protein
MNVLTMSIITAVLIIIFIISLIFNESFLSGFLITLIICIGLFGYGAYFNSTEKIMVEKIKPISITKSDYYVYVEFNNDIRKCYDSKKDYKKINENTIFYKITSFSYYKKVQSEVISKDEKYSNIEYNIKIDQIK